MNGCVELLAYAVSEDIPYQAERHWDFAYAITVRKKKLFSVNLNGPAAIDNIYSQFIRDIIKDPDVVVSDEPCEAYSCIGEFCQFPEETTISAGYDIAVFVPIIKNVTEQVYGFCIIFYGIKEVDHAFLGIERIFECA